MPDDGCTIKVTPRRVVWLSEEDQQRGIAIPFSDIAMHAMCSDTSSFPRPCVYAQLQSDFADEASDDDDAEEATELRFSPQDAGAVLEPMFKAFCDGAAMNPDEDLQGMLGGCARPCVLLLLGASLSHTEEGAAPLFFNSEEVMAGAEPAAREAMLARLDGMLDEGEFDEVDEEEDALYEDADEDGQPSVNGR